MLTIKRILKSSSIALVVILVCFLLMVQGPFKASADITEIQQGNSYLLTLTDDDLYNFLISNYEIYAYVWEEGNYGDGITLEFGEDTNNDGRYMTVISESYGGNSLFCLQPVGGEYGYYSTANITLYFTSSLKDNLAFGIDIQAYAPKFIYSAYPSGYAYELTEFFTSVTYTVPETGDQIHSEINDYTPSDPALSSAYPAISWGYDAQGNHIVDSFNYHNMITLQNSRIGSSDLHYFFPNGVNPFEFNSFSISLKYTNSNDYVVTPYFYLTISELTLSMPNDSYKEILKNQEDLLDYLQRKPDATMEEIQRYLDFLEDYRSDLDDVLESIDRAENPFNDYSYDDVDAEFFSNVLTPSIMSGTYDILNGLEWIYLDPTLSIIVLFSTSCMVAGFLLTGKAS